MTPRFLAWVSEQMYWSVTELGEAWGKAGLEQRAGE